MLFSIIVPVYNAEKTLCDCLKSIQMQTFPHFEVLLVDDGSSDNSLDICRQYAERDQRFVVFHQDNEGPSAARNVGLEHASGAYVTFVDSDDALEKDYLSSLYHTFLSSDADVVFMGYIEYDSRKKDMQMIHCPKKDKRDYYGQLAYLSSKGLFGYTWIKAFKKQVIGKRRFRRDISLFEDEIFTCEVMKVCKKIEILPRAVYIYRRYETETLMDKTRADYVYLQDLVYQAWESMLGTCSNKKEILQQRANMLAVNCKYYYFERKISIKLLYDLQDSFFTLVRNKKWFVIKILKAKYRLKIKFSRLKYRKGKI